MPGEDGRLPDVRMALELVRLYLDAARDAPTTKFVLAEVDCLKPYFDAYPEDRAAKLAAETLGEHVCDFFLRIKREEWRNTVIRSPRSNWTATCPYCEPGGRLEG